MGLIAVALLTLTPLALRPVRLACLIHAANVHSEPGSNPSKMYDCLGFRLSELFLSQAVQLESGSMIVQTEGGR